RLDLLEIFEERYRRKSTLITAQLPVAQWHDMIRDATLADAILDRVVHNAHRISLQGDRMRQNKAPPPRTHAEISESNNPHHTNKASENRLRQTVRDLAKQLSGI